MLDFKLHQKPKMILFDLDDTLVGSTRIYQVCYGEMALDMKAFNEAKAWVKTTLGPGHVSAHQRLLYFKRYLEMKKEFSSQKLLHLVGHYEELLQKHIRNEWKSLKREALFAQLKTKFRLALVTNETTRTQVLKLNAIDPEGQYFEFMVTSEDVGVEKPGAKIFAEVFRRASLSPENCLMLGDSVANDLQPLKAVGASVIGTCEFLSPEKEDSKNYFWIEDLNQLLQVLN